ncbi:hypothetical protein AG1IA_07132 [Rhizoctonia solani AG-1 IA]|uniref:Uncharacterized protein n=1 Tax=Thanatephorus cucumeris (strain AG1-IA) TaxID=983506 RepID=L8WQ01_THACA|nr:hypothetical protein AG1IA_07132 [Rhizoctonia solani AG-1 IA]
MLRFCVSLLTLDESRPTSYSSADGFVHCTHPDVLSPSPANIGQYIKPPPPLQHFSEHLGRETPVEHYLSVYRRMTPALNVISILNGVELAQVAHFECPVSVSLVASRWFVVDFTFVTGLVNPSGNVGIASYHIHLPNPATKYGPGGASNVTSKPPVRTSGLTDAIPVTNHTLTTLNSLHEELSCTSHEAAFLTLDEPDDWVIVNVNTPERE